MKFSKYYIGFILILQSGFFLFSQSAETDSLKNLIRADKEDTIKAIHLNSLCWNYFTSGSYDSALHYGKASLVLAQRLNFDIGIAEALTNIGIINYEHGNYPKALDNYFKALKICEALGNKKKVARILSNIGVVYKEQKNPIKSLEYYTRALTLDEESGNKMGVARDLGNIGLFYTEQNNYSKALECYKKVLVLAEELGSKKLLADTYGNIGILFNGQGDSSISKGNFSFALSDRYPKALEFYFKGYTLSEELADKNAIATCLGRIGWIYADMKNYEKAESYLLKAIAATKETGALYFEKEYHNKIIGVYTAKRDYKNALEHLRLYRSTKDTLFSAEKNKELTRYDMNYEFEKKEAVIKAEQGKKDAVTIAERKKQKIVLWLVLCGVFLVIIFTLFVFRSLRITKKQKILIEVKNKETELQKKIIEEKNNGILDSIHYAKRIQNSLLPSELFIERILKQLKKS